MDFRLVEHFGSIYVVVGIGYGQDYDPPDVFFCVPLRGSIVRSALLEEFIIVIPISEAEEITDPTRLKAIWALYGK